MSFSLFSVAIIFLFAVILAIEVYRGIHLGVRHAMISLCSIAVSVALSVALAPLVSMLITSIVFRFVMPRITAYQKLLGMFSSLDTLIQALASILISSLLFVGMFFLLRVGIEVIVKMIIRFTKKRNSSVSEYRIEGKSYIDRNSKVLGGVAGAISAIVITMVITAPIMGTFDIANRVIGTVERVNTKVVNQIGEKNVTAIKKYSMDLPGNVFYQFGGKYMYQNAASTYMYGSRVDLMSEVKAIDKTVEDGMALYRAMINTKVGTYERVACVYELCTDIEDINMCHGLAAEVVSKAATAWLNGDTFYGIRMPSMAKTYGSTVDELLTVYSGSNVKNIKPNAVTALKVFAVLVDSKVIYLSPDDYDELIDRLSNGQLINKISAILDENPNMRQVSVSSLILSAVSKNIKIDGFEEEEFDNLSENLAQAINSVNKKGYGSEDERASALASLAVKYMEEYGMSISTDIAKLVAKELLNSVNYAEGDISAEHIRQVIDEYAN